MFRRLNDEPEKRYVVWPKNYKQIPKPYYVCRCGDHFIVCELDKDFNLIDEKSSIHWNKFIVRKWAFEIFKPKKL